MNYPRDSCIKIPYYTHYIGVYFRQNLISRPIYVFANVLNYSILYITAVCAIRLVPLHDIYDVRESGSIISFMLRDTIPANSFMRYIFMYIFEWAFGCTNIQCVYKTHFDVDNFLFSPLFDTYITAYNTVYPYIHLSYL